MRFCINKIRFNVFYKTERVKDKEVIMSKVLFVVSPTLNSFVDPKKGTTGNKIDCAMKHFANSTVSNATIATLKKRKNT